MVGICIRNCFLKYLNNFVPENEKYQTVDFLYGSSGSLVFSDTGNFIAMDKREVLMNPEDPNCKVSLLEQGVSIKHIINGAYSHVKWIPEDLFPEKFHKNNDVTPMNFPDT